MKVRIGLVLLVMTMGGLLGGCQSAAQGPERPVEAYYAAITGGERERISQLVCAAFEETALTEFDSFSGVKSSLDGLSCTSSEQRDGEAQVTCQGNIQATYGEEQMTFPLADRVHRVVKEGNDWLLCGY